MDMRKILSGSRAILANFPDFTRKCDDHDYIVPFSKFYEKEHKVEYKEIPAIWDYVSDTDEYLPANVIYTLKCSHVYWPIKQVKHLSDIYFMQKRGCQIIEPLFWELYEHWVKIHGKRKGEPDFNKNKRRILY